MNQRKTGHVFSVSAGPRTEKELSVIKSGTVCSYILSDLKPCIEADVLIGGVSVHASRVLFDTGANVSVINPHSIPDADGTDEGMEVRGANSSGTSRTYYCSISLDGGEIVLSNVRIEAFGLDIFDGTDIDLIIGMDVITLGEFSVKKNNRLPVFSFSI